MLEDVVVAWDGSARSREALEWAVRRPATRRVRFVRVLGDDGSDSLIEVGPRLLLDHAIEQLRDRYPDLEINGEVLHGDVERVLVLESVRGSILTIGTGGDAASRFPHRSAMLGRLAHRAVGPVALVPLHPRAHAGAVVAALDGTRAGVAATQIAAAEAQSVGTSVIVVHMRTPDGAPPDGPTDACVRDLATHYPRLLVQHRMGHGNAEAELRQSATSSSLMVLGRHEIGGAGSRVIEDALTGTSTVPLLLVSETDLLWPANEAVATSRATRF